MFGVVRRFPTTFAATVTARSSPTILPSCPTLRLSTSAPVLQPQKQPNGGQTDFPSINTPAKSEDSITEGSNAPNTSTATGSSKPVDGVRDWARRNAFALHVRMDEISSATRAELAQIGRRVNDLTGYNEIEILKRLVTENESRMHSVREAARAAKKAYEDAVARRSCSQRELNDLLQRKSTWTEADVLRFTGLVRTDHSRELEEAQTRIAAADADNAVERQFDELMRSILGRYHEEQVWSDKIRGISTYGSLAVLGLNLVVFVLALVLVEPWKRRRLMQSFVEKVHFFHEEASRHTNARLDALCVHQETQEKLLRDMLTMIAHPSQAPVPVESTEECSNERAIEGDPSRHRAPVSSSARGQSVLTLSAAGVLLSGVAGILWKLSGC